MSSVALDANVTIKKNKSLKKEYQVGESLVYKDYVAPGPSGNIAINQVLLGTTSSDLASDSGQLGLQGTGAVIELGNITGSSGSYGNSKLRLERDKLAFQVPTANSLGSYDYGTAGHVLTSGGSSSAMSWGAAALFPNDVSIDNSELKFTSGTSVNATAESPANGGHPYLKFAVADSGNSHTLTEYLRINEKGAIGVKDGSSIDFGTSGQVLTSASSTGPPTWTTPSGGGGSGSGSIVPSSTAFDPTEDEDTATMKSIRNYLATLIDIEPPVFTGGRFLAVGNQGTSITKVVGDTFDPFTYPVTNVTCTDSPTAGPKKGQTISIPLDWRNFEFRSSLTSGANTVVTHATVFDTVTNDPVYEYPHGSYGALTGSGFNETDYTGGYPSGTTLGGFHAAFDEPQGIYAKFQMNNSDDHYGRLINIFMADNTFTEEMSIELQHVEFMQKSNGPGFMFKVVVRDGSTTLGEERMESATGDLEHGEDYEVYVTWNKMTSADGEGRPRRYDITIAHRKTDGGEWVVDTSPAQQVQYNSDGTTTELNTLAMFSSSSSDTNGRTSHYHRRTDSALTFGIWNWDGQQSSTVGNGTLKEIKLYNDYISSPTFFDSQHWQATSTFKSAGTRYLRYKATDEAGNETPNTDDHYLTINVNS